MYNNNNINENRTILMVALDQLSDHKETVISLDIEQVREVCEHFNEGGFMVLLATFNGEEVLENPKNRPMGWEDINYPLSLSDLKDEDLEDFCAIYLLSTQGIKVKDIKNVPQVSKILKHCERTNKMVALQSGKDSQIIYPRLKNSDELSKEIDNIELGLERSKPNNKRLLN